MTKSLKPLKVLYPSFYVGGVCLDGCQPGKRNASESNETRKENSTLNQIVNTMIACSTVMGRLVKNVAFVLSVHVTRVQVLDTAKIWLLKKTCFFKCVIFTVCNTA